LNLRILLWAGIFFLSPSHNYQQSDIRITQGVFGSWDEGIINFILFYFIFMCLVGG